MLLHKFIGLQAVVIVIEIRLVFRETKSQHQLDFFLAQRNVGRLVALFESLYQILLLYVALVFLIQLFEALLENVEADGRIVVFLDVFEDHFFEGLLGNVNTLLLGNFFLRRLFGFILFLFLLLVFLFSLLL